MRSHIGYTRSPTDLPQAVAGSVHSGRNQVSTAAQPARTSRAADEYARDLAGRIGRFLLVVLGLIIMAAGLVVTVLPGHLGLPILVIGLMIVLRNSFKARRRFARMQKAHPKVIFPLRRLMRREPEVMPVAWQQLLRMERLIPHPRMRMLVRLRRKLRRYMRRRRHEAATRKAAKLPPVLPVAPSACPAE